MHLPLIALVAAFPLLGGGLPPVAEPAERSDAVEVTAAPASEAQPPRASFTTHAAVLAPGELNLEGGVQAVRFRDGATSRDIPTQLLLGLLPRLEFHVFWTGWCRQTSPEAETRAGATDPWLGLQAQFLDQASRGVDLALGYWHRFPRTSPEGGIGDGCHEDQVFLALSRRQGPFLLDVNLLQNLLPASEGQDRLRQGGVSACLTWSPHANLHLSAEVYALEGTRRGPRVVSNLWSVAYAWNERLTLDAGIDLGLSREAPRHTVFLGLSWSFGRVFGPRRP